MHAHPVMKLQQYVGATDVVQERPAAQIRRNFFGTFAFAQRFYLVEGSVGMNGLPSRAPATSVGSRLPWQGSPTTTLAAQTRKRFRRSGCLPRRTGIR
jgi:hypothetical protein